MQTMHKIVLFVMFAMLVASQFPNKAYSQTLTPVTEDEILGKDKKKQEPKVSSPPVVEEQMVLDSVAPPVKTAKNPPPPPKNGYPFKVVGNTYPVNQIGARLSYVAQQNQTMFNSGFLVDVSIRGNAPDALDDILQGASAQFTMLTGDNSIVSGRDTLPNHSEVTIGGLNYSIAGYDIDPYSYTMWTFDIGGLMINSIYTQSGKTRSKNYSSQQKSYLVKGNFYIENQSKNLFGSRWAFDVCGTYQADADIASAMDTTALKDKPFNNSSIYAMGEFSPLYVGKEFGIGLDFGASISYSFGSKSSTTGLKVGARVIWGNWQLLSLEAWMYSEPKAQPNWKSYNEIWLHTYPISLGTAIIKKLRRH